MNATLWKGVPQAVRASRPGRGAAGWAQASLSTDGQTIRPGVHFCSDSWAQKAEDRSHRRPIHIRPRRL